MTKRQLETLSFDNSYARLPEAFYAKLNPTPFAAPPHLVSFNPAAAELIDLDPEQAKRPEFAGVFGGSLLVPGMEPLAMLYSGHHFGVYVPQLGDRRALLLGEVRGERGEKWDLHLKGAWHTPFSREGDGRAVLRLYGQHYKDCGPTLATEKLAERHGITLSAETLWTSTRVTCGGFQAAGTQRLFPSPSRRHEQRADRGMPIPTPHNNNPPRLYPAAAREGPRPRTHCSICLVQ